MRRSITVLLLLAFTVTAFQLTPGAGMDGAGNLVLLPAVMAVAPAIAGAVFFGTQGAVATVSASAVILVLRARRLGGLTPSDALGMAILIGLAILVGMHTDHLRQSRRRFSLLLANSNDAVYSMNPSTGTLEYMSPAVERIMGYTPAEMTRMSPGELDDLVHPEDRELRRQLIADLLVNSGRVRRAQQVMEYRARHRDGHYIWLSDSRHVVFDRAGRPVTIEGVDRDITARKQWEQALRNSEERYRLLVEDSRSVFFYTHDPAGQFTFISQSVKEVLGYDPEDLVGRSYNITLDDSVDQSIVIGATEAALSTGQRQPPYMIQAKGKDGRRRTLEIVDTPVIRQGEVTGIQGFARDVTEQQEAAEALVKSKQRLTSLHLVADRLGLCEDAEGVYRVMLTSAVDVLGFDWCALCLYKDGQFDVRVHPPREGGTDTFTMSADVGAAGLTFRTGRTLVAGDIRQVSWARPISLPVRSLICVPLGEVGVFQIQSPSIDAFDDDDVRLAELLANHASQWLRRLDLESELRRLAVHDQLTGLYNRTYLEAEIQRLSSGRWHPVSVIAADIDGLKLINDTLGHGVGDEMLVRCSTALSSVVRKSDVAARTGGDEFALLLPRTTASTAEKIAGRIRQAVQRDNGATPSIPLSVSLGVATSSDHAGGLDEALREADNRMYRDKMSRSKSARSTMVNALVATLAERDYLTQGHADRMRSLALALGDAVGLTSGQQSELALLTQIHDLGKVGISDSILFKPDPLTADEREEMERHPEIGYRIIRSSPDMAHTADLILHHHEWWDGSGYPCGLRGDAIPIQCRILTIVDAFDAMTSDRPYRGAMPVDEAIEELKRTAGTQFDPQLVDIFINRRLWEQSTPSTGGA